MKTDHTDQQSRREMLKKIGTTSAFIVPTVLSLRIADVQAAASVGTGLYNPPAPPECPD